MYLKYSGSDILNNIKIIWESSLTPIHPKIQNIKKEME